MATIINADTSNGLKLTSDTSGIIELQSGGTTKATVNSSGFNGGTGSILQMVMVTPDPGLVTTTNTTFAETTSLLRLAITPKSASSTLVLTMSFKFGGGFSSQISQFKFYDHTNSADVNLGTAGSRLGCHGSARQVDTDDNDGDSIQFTTTVASGSTTARTYTMYNRKEGSDTAYYFAAASDSYVLGYAKPTFTIMEVAG